MTPLTLAPILAHAGIDPLDAIAIRHAYSREHDGIHADSTDEEILAYTRDQTSDRRFFPAVPPRFWIVFIKEGGDQARLWAVLENRGQVSDNGSRRTFDLVETDHLADLRERLVVGWRSPRSFWMHASTAAPYPVVSIADAQPVPFPGFDRLILEHPQLQAVMREHRYAAWRTALASVVGIYLITDTRDGRHYVGKADGKESIRQRWNAYATNGHGGNRDLIGRDPESFRFSLLRVFDPSTPTEEINAAESHFKGALDSRTHGLNAN